MIPPSPLSLATIAGYWLWFLYLKYLKMESEASKEVCFKMQISYPLLNHATVWKPMTLWITQHLNWFYSEIWSMVYDNIWLHLITIVCIFSKEEWVSGWPGSTLLSSFLFSSSTGHTNHSSGRGSAPSVILELGGWNKTFNLSIQDIRKKWPEELRRYAPTKV